MYLTGNYCNCHERNTPPAYANGGGPFRPLAPNVTTNVTTKGRARKQRRAASIEKPKLYKGLLCDIVLSLGTTQISLTPWVGLFCRVFGVDEYSRGGSTTGDFEPVGRRRNATTPL